MVYYGMNSFTCHAVHFPKWFPYEGQYWCPLCEKLRVGNPMSTGRLITKDLIKGVLKSKDDS